ncbi:MAG TPA: FkbM family methyltransferase [Longimicrobium sp.]|nr:FkbM family methyltransferase [Longimicrobium sp.]
MTSLSETIASDAPAIAHFDVRGVRFSIDVADMPHPPMQNPYFRRSQLGHLYEPTMTFCLAQILSKEPDAVFLDVGSRMGYYASFAAACLGDGSRVHAVEADPAYAVRTARSCAATGYPEASVYGVILSDSEETVAVDGHRGVVYDEPSAGSTTAVTTDALCARHGFAPTVVKVDVHGCEGKVLMGMETVLRDHVRYLLLELHDAFRLEQYSPGISRSQILRFLEELGFSLFHVAAEVVPYPFVRDEGFTYRLLTSDAWPDVFFDRGGVVFVLASKTPDIASVIGPSVDDPRFF